MAVVSVLNINEEKMNMLANMLAKYTVAGDFIALNGTLGMGKSTFARAFVRAMANDDALTVPSPTFTLMQPYDETRLPTAHVDAYRMADPEELYALDLESYFEHGVVLMEWPERVADMLPEQTAAFSYPMESDIGGRLDIEITEGEGEGRTLMFTPYGSWAQRLGLVLPQQCARPSTNEGRQAFLKKVNMEGELVALTPDFSMRTYHRLGLGEQTYILMDAPPPMESTACFEKVTNYLRSINIHAPEIIAADHKQGYLLLEDIGDDVLKNILHEGDCEAWAEVVIDTLVHIAKQPKVELENTYDANAIWQECSRYVDWYLPGATGHATHVDHRQEFQNIILKLKKHMDKMPSCFSHWDFHSDNLMAIKAEPKRENLGVIDYEDARWGNIAVDIACFLEDRFPENEPLKEKMKQRFLESFDVNREDFNTAYAITTVHRYLKIVGLLERLDVRDGRTDVKGRMPQAWEALRKFTTHPALREVKEFLEKHSPKEMGL